MSLPSRSFLRVRSRRRVALALAVAVLLAGIVQAAHYHKDELGHLAGTNVHCLLCLYAGGTAPLPVLPAVPAAPPPNRDDRSPRSIPCLGGIFAASYDARGPPKA